MRFLALEREIIPVRDRMDPNRCLSAKQKVRQLVGCTYFSAELKSKLEALSRGVGGRGGVVER